LSTLRNHGNPRACNTIMAAGAPLGPVRRAASARPAYDPAHPLGCHKPRIADRIIFEKPRMVVRSALARSALLPLHPVMSDRLANTWRSSGARSIAAGEAHMTGVCKTVGFAICMLCSRIRPSPHRRLCSRWRDVVTLRSWRKAVCRAPLPVDGLPTALWPTAMADLVLPCLAAPSRPGPIPGHLPRPCRPPLPRSLSRSPV
jgi:hypothetical protein